MFTPKRIAAVNAALCASVLAWAFHGASLVAAGPYKAMPEVQVGAAVGTCVAYFVVLFAIGWLSFTAQGIRSRLLRWSALVLGLLGSIVALWLAPALSFLLLAAVCQVEAACPHAANPIGWAFLQLAPPRDVPFSPAWFALLAFLLPIGLHTLRGSSANEV